MWGDSSRDCGTERMLVVEFFVFVEHNNPEHTRVERILEFILDRIREPSVL
jgi:hypothetical protein